MKTPRQNLFFSRLCIISLLILSCFHQASCLTTGDKYCGVYVCVSVTLRDNSPAEIIVATTQSTVGWIGIGVGDAMFMADLTAHWQNPDGSLTISRRASQNKAMPPALPSQSAYTYITKKGTASITDATPLLWQYLRPVNLTESTLDRKVTGFIWAFSKAGVSSSSPSSDIGQHVVQGNFNLDLTKVVADTPLPAPIPTTTPSANIPTAMVSGSVTLTSIPASAPQNTINPFANQTISIAALTRFDIMVISHGCLMFTAMYILVPVAIFLARYKREMQHWVRAHYIVQVIAFAMVLGGGYLGYAQSYGSHLKTNHQIIGVTILGVFFVQLLLGFLIHGLYDPNRDGRPFRNVIHKFLGRCTFLLAISATPLGLREYLAPKPFTIIYWLWIGVLFVFFFFYEVTRRSAKSLDKKANKLGWTQEQTRYEEMHELNLQ